MTRNVPQPPMEPCEPQSADARATSDLLMVDSSKIRPYERNPRQGRNPEYDRIKDSIRNNGLDQPLVITQRPGATDYIVHAGGNTRLMIVKELFDETGDARFSRVPCLFRPWSRESDTLLAHLRENDLRGPLTYIDKARAVHTARQLLGEELGLKEVSLRRLEAELGNAGYRIANSDIGLMVYTVETLLGVIPQALEAGMGRHQVKRIRALERAAKQLWQRYGAGDEDAFDEVFAALCRRYDGLEWDAGLLQGALETEIAEEAETSLHTIRVALEAEINRRELVIPEFVPIKAPPRPERRDDTDGNPETDERFTTQEEPMTEDAFTPDEADEPGFHREDESPVDPLSTINQRKESHHEPVAEVPESVRDAGLSQMTDLKSLRGRAWTLATRLAQRNGIGELVVPLSGKGLGFVLRDVPDPVLADQLDEEALAQICMLWWQLAACAEMTFAPLEAIVPLLPTDSVLRRALEDEDAELLFNSIWTLDPGHTGYRLWRSLPERDWSDLLTLMDTYRRIRQVAADTGATIWA
jgi:ParB family protein of integrating conjugative element (PFGI_1 class)